MAETPTLLHRGLSWQDMPGRHHLDKRLNFSLFKRGSFPPWQWKIPSHAEGPALVLLIEERLTMMQPQRRIAKAKQNNP